MAAYTGQANMSSSTPLVCMGISICDPYVFAFVWKGPDYHILYLQGNNLASAKQSLVPQSKCNILSQENEVMPLLGLLRI